MKFHTFYLSEDHEYEIALTGRGEERFTATYFDSGRYANNNVVVGKFKTKPEAVKACEEHKRARESQAS